MRRTTLILLVLMLLVIAIIAGWWWREKAKQTLPAEAPKAPVLEFTGSEEGWPPRVKGAQDIREVSWQEIPGSLTDALEAEIRQAAVQDQRVRDQLGQRFAYISTDAIEVEKEQMRDPSQPLATRVTFFSHTNNIAIEVRMIGTTVESVTKLEAAQPPEGAEEIKEAIGLAERDSHLRGKLEGLTGAALLAFPEQGQPGYGHRILDVTFTKEGEDLPRYFALVDLTDQKVLVAGPIEARRR